MTALRPTIVPNRRKRRRWPIVLGVVAAVVAVLVVASSFITLPYYVLVPGDAVPVTNLISVPGQKPAQVLHGKILLTDVGVSQVRLINYLPDLLDSNVALVRSSALLGSAPASEFYLQGAVDMAESQLTAKVAALRQLGYSVPETNAGAVIYQIVPGSPAWRQLVVGDVITRVGNSPVTSTAGLVAAIRAQAPGATVTLGIDNLLEHSQRTISVRLSSAPGSPRTAFLGVYALTQAAYAMPVGLHLSSDGIGGPSAGLAFTLGILDKLAGGDITGGKVVAATGTMHPDGTVGPVGGVSEKTIAVERAGASVFLVPPAEFAKAEAKATPGLHVIAVSSLSQALRALARLGGHLGRAARGPLPGPGGHSAPPGWQEAPWS
ncbi:MAG: PDZ domain-containing protein [Actinomycetota bacterium]|jgi:PDZ domain-containing protein|nr:PDZ domain-containing protein [Actinomycetota bacterium]